MGAGGWPPGLWCAAASAMPVPVPVAGLGAAASVVLMHSRLWPARQWTFWQLLSQYAACRHRMHRECAPFLPHVAHTVMPYSMLDAMPGRWCQSVGLRAGCDTHQTPDVMGDRTNGLVKSQVSHHATR